MELNLWQTLLISASGGVIGGLVAQVLSFGIELLRWRRDDRIRKKEWELDVEVERREALRELYERMFKLLDEALDAASLLTGTVLIRKRGPTSTRQSATGFGMCARG